VNRVTAQAMFKRLQNAYPFSDLVVDSGRLYVDELEKMDEELGRQAVTSVIEGSLLFPSIAELLEHYRIVREQRRRAERDVQRKAQAVAYDNLPRPALRDIPSAVELMERWEPRLALEQVSDGECADCDKDGKRYRYNRLALCSDCAFARGRVKAAVFLFGEE
jgi:hypothetical protein